MTSSESSSPFGVPLFRAVWTASLVSNIGALVQAVGASWMMTTLGAGPRSVAMVQGCTTAPIMLLSLWAGAVADNLDRRRVMLAAQVFMLITSTILAVGAWLGAITPGLLLLVTFLLGCGAAVNGPAWQASVGDMVPRSLLPGAVSYNSMGFNVARSLGPALGGAIVAFAGAAAAFLLNALSYVGLIIVLMRWTPDVQPRTLPRERLITAMQAGMRYVWLSPYIRTVLLRAAMFGIAAGAVPALMPLVARDRLHGGAIVYGLLLGAFGIGAVAGALASTRLRARMSVEMLVRAAAISLASAAVIEALVQPLAILLPFLALGGAGWVIALSTFNISVQMGSPRWVVARAIALYQMAAFGGMAVGSWMFGSLASVHGVPSALIAAGAFQLAGVLLGLWLPLPQIASLDLGPRSGWREPDTAVPIEVRSGPIVLTLDHRIDPTNIPAFLALMGERRRIRRRDGAQHWDLLRDLGEPDLWIERFQFATWVDYVRYNQRRTVAEDIDEQALRALWIDGRKPVVHRRIQRQTGSLPTTRAPDARELDVASDAARQG